MAVSRVAGTPGDTAPARGPVRVMVVDDSIVIRGLVSRWVDEDPDLETVAGCANGQIAVDRMASARPGVIVLDIEMPVMDGLQALPLLVKAEPRPHVIVASTLTRRNAAVTLKALTAGASDCVPKPDSHAGTTTSAEFRRELIAKIRALGGLDPAARISAPAGTQQAAAPLPPAAGRATASGFALVPFHRMAPKLLAIGSSTGGPKALSTVLAAAASRLDRVPTLVTQHMPPTFTEMLAENLARATGRPAKEAEAGETPKPGTIYVAPGGKHLVVRRSAGGLVMALDDRPQINFTKPSVDVMFDSLAEACGSSTLAVVLTGMGSDGAIGATGLRAAGANILAQDEATSVVWGMPGAAAHAGVCSAVLALDDIGPCIGRLVSGGKP